MARKTIRLVLVSVSLFILSTLLLGCSTPNDTIELEELNYDIESAYLPRVNFGQKYEPKGNYILHGAGQVPADGLWVSFDSYVAALGDVAIKPCISMAYASPHHDYDTWAAVMKSEMERYPDDYVMLQIGTHFNNDEDASRVYYDKIADGEMDAEVIGLIEVFESFDRPVFVRPGFEFNGQWNGYTDASIYKRAFIRFCELIEQVGAKNIATVWCYNPDATEKDYLKYYPGDQYVDWWAIDIFRIGSIESWNSLQFLADAEAHKKPVMLSEVTPYTYDLSADEGWEEWFVPFFDFVRDHPVIKATCYINWRWADYPWWSDWGDSRLQESTTVLPNYIEEISDPIYLHAGPQEEFTSLLYRYEPLGE